MISCSCFLFLLPQIYLFVLAAGFTETGELVEAGVVEVVAAGLAAGACVGAWVGCELVAFAAAGRKPRLPGLLSISAAR